MWHNNYCKPKLLVAEGPSSLTSLPLYFYQWRHNTCLSQSRFSAAAAKSLQSCLILCDPVDSSPPGSPVPGILQARNLEWVAISFSNAWKWKVKGKLLSHVQLLATSWSAAYQVPLSMGFSRQEYWSGVPFNVKLWATTDNYRQRQNKLHAFCVFW